MHSAYSQQGNVNMETSKPVPRSAEMLLLRPWLLTPSPQTPLIV